MSITSADFKPKFVSFSKDFIRIVITIYENVFSVYRVITCVQMDGREYLIIAPQSYKHVYKRIIDLYVDTTKWRPWPS
jgi:hypothetical protein